jgi:hypothetical protein
MKMTKDGINYSLVEPQIFMRKMLSIGTVAEEGCQGISKFKRLSSKYSLCIMKSLE